VKVRVFSWAPSLSINTAMSVVWILREMRSGSTAFAETLAEQLARPHMPIVLHAGTSHPLSTDEDMIYSTHSFHTITQLDSYQDPILIRCTRRDLTEQCISHLIATTFNSKVPNLEKFWNMRRPKGKNQNIFDTIEPLTFTKKQVVEYLDLNKSWKIYWDTHAHKYRNYTVYYEDLCEEGVDIPDLGVYSFSINDETATTQRLPNYKNRICLNHAMIQKWISEY